MNNHRHSDFYIDERGIFELESSSYPDYVGRNFHVEFNADEETQTKDFEKFMQHVLMVGRKQRSRELFAVLTDGRSGF